jgi:hypothetical protein
MSHDLKQSLTMVIGFLVGFTMAYLFLPSSLALAISSGIACSLLSGAFFAQVSYGDVFWHVGESAASGKGSNQSSIVPKTTSANAGQKKFSNGNTPTEKRTNGRDDKTAHKKSFTSSLSTLRFQVMNAGSRARRKKNGQNEKLYWKSYQRAKTFIPGLQEQQGRRYQRRVKPREGLRIDS